MIIPEDYKPHLNLIETEVAIKMIKDTFERRLAEQLRLTRVSAPLFLLKNTMMSETILHFSKWFLFFTFYFEKNTRKFRSEFSGAFLYSFSYFTLILFPS